MASWTLKEMVGEGAIRRRIKESGRNPVVGDAGNWRKRRYLFTVFNDEVLVFMNHPIGGRQQTLSHELWADHWLLTSHLVPTILTGTDY